METFQPTEGWTEQLRDEASVVLLEKESETDELGSFDILAYTGACVDRWWGDMVIDVDGIRHEKQTTLLLEHNDQKPLGVIMKHKKGSDGLRLSGHFLGSEASPEAHKLRLQCREQAPGKPGLKLKSSIGVRFVKYRFLEEEDEPVVVNGKTYKYSSKKDTLIVEKSHLFENSIIYVNPADIGTQAEIMRHGNGAQTMSDKISPATAALLSASGGETVPAPKPIVHFSELSDDGKRAAVQEARQEITKKSAEFKDAFPDKAPEWREQMLAEGKTVQDAKLVLFDQSEGERRKQASEKLVNDRIADRLAASSGRDGRGFDASRAERSEPARIEVGRMFSPSRQAEERLHKHPLAVEFFGHEALSVMTRSLNFEALEGIENAKLDNSEKAIVLHTATILEAAKLLWDSTPQAKREKAERFAGVGHSGVDLSVITVKGFIDSYHDSMMKEQAWGVEICFPADSNQQSEVLRWLAYFPQLQVFNDYPEENPILAYQISWTSEWYDASVYFDVQDYELQKFGKIDKLMGNSGAVHARHWNKLVANELEANRTGYDGKTLFHASHAMGGRAPTAQSNDLSAANGNGYCAIPDLGNITESQINAALFNAAAVPLNYFAANGEPLNEETSREVVVIAPHKFGTICEAGVFAKRLDGNPGGAGGSRDNPIAVSSEKTGDKWRVVKTARLASQTGHTTDNYVYIAILGNDRKPVIKAEPSALKMFFSGPGTEIHRLKNQYGFWGRTLRTTCPGAWSSIVRVKLGV